jgi:hypothetical protein
MAKDTTPNSELIDIISLIDVANPGRKLKNMDRRIMKAGEEYGEAVQAFLAVTSKNNKKQKSWADVREELSDFVIVGLDVLLTRFPDEDKKITDAEIRNRLIAEIQRKLGKWTDKTDAQEVKDDAE